MCSSQCRQAELLIIYGLTCNTALSGAIDSATAAHAALLKASNMH